MARSPANPPIRSVAAAAAYVGFWALLAALVAPEPRVDTAILLASHGPQRAAAWSVAHRVYDEVERRGRRLGPAERTGVARAIVEEAARAAMDPLLVLAVIHVESRFDVRAVSNAGAIGLMQLLAPTMREEAARSGMRSADPFDPVANVRAGVRYLDRMVDAFQSVEVALMAYNAGPARIRRHLREGGVPQRLLGYPRTVLRERARLSAATPDGAADAAIAARRRELAAAHAPAGTRDPAWIQPARDGLVISGRTGAAWGAAAPDPALPPRNGARSRSGAGGARARPSGPEV